MLDVGKMVDAVLEAIDKPLRALAERINALETRAPEKGEPGRDGKDGQDGIHGRDGRDAADLALLQAHIDERIADGIATVLKAATIETPDFGRTWLVTLGDKTHTVKMAVPLDAGVWRSETVYQRGDTVSHGGSMWIAQQDTDTKPDTPDCHWRLAIKRGRDGKDGKPGERGAAGPKGERGDRGERGFAL